MRFDTFIPGPCRSGLPPSERGRVGEGVSTGSLQIVDPHPTRIRASTSPFQGEVEHAIFKRLAGRASQR